MLKIKDNIPLEKLEKYGFGKSWTAGDYRYFLDNIATLWVSEATRELSIEVDGRPFHEEIYTIDIIYILIKADLIEKVEG